MKCIYALIKILILSGFSEVYAQKCPPIISKGSLQEIKAVSVTKALEGRMGCGVVKQTDTLHSTITYGVRATIRRRNFSDEYDTIPEAVTDTLPIGIILDAKLPIRGATKVFTHCSIVTYKPIIAYKISGRITDNNYKPIPFASIQIPGDKIGTVADSLGNYSLSIPAAHFKKQLGFSSMGYRSKIIDYPGHERSLSTDVILNPVDTFYSAIEVIAYGTTRCGGIIACGWHRGSKGIKAIEADTAIASTASIFEKHISIFPNPASKNSVVNIRMDKGAYHLSLVENSGKVIHQSEVNNISKANSFAYRLPVNLAAGIHYIVITDKANGKRYVEKLIIQ